MQRLGLTPDVVVGAVHHVCGVDEVVAGAFHAQLHLVVAQHDFTSADQNNVKTPAETLALALTLRLALTLSSALPGVDAGGREVQLVFGLEEQRLGADLHDGGRLHGRGHGEERQLWVHQRPVLRHPVLAVDEFQAAAEVQRLADRKSEGLKSSRPGKRLGLSGLPGSRRSCPGGSGSGSRSFSPGRRSFPEGWSEGRSSTRWC